MFDQGIPLITEKSILVQMLRKPDIIQKATDAITGHVHDRHSNPLQQALHGINNDPGALWRLPTDFEGKGGDEMNSAREITATLSEFADCIFNA